MKKPVVAYIRQLCCLGLGGQIIMPELLHALHAFIPSASNMFLWADEHHQISNVYCEDSALYSVQSLYFKEFYNSKEVQVYKIGFSEAMRIGRGWGNSERLGPDFVSSELFNELLRPNGVRYGLEATILEHGRGLGSVVLNRAPGEKPFSDADEMSLRSLIPYIAHGLRGTRDLRGELTPSGESGTVIIDSHDQIVQFCHEGKRLLLASHPGRKMRDAPSLDSPALQRLSANLRGILRGRLQPVPMLRQQHAGGEFVFRAYPLGTHGEANGSIAVVIERHEPLPLKLLRNMSTLPMTARQREVCLLLSYGHSHSMIAQRMHVSKHTATDYVRKIYDKLDVNGHDQLMKKLESITVH
ncbi:MAG: helix-turn-helix transcriptional regulator [Sulfuriferula sp.]